MSHNKKFIQQKIKNCKFLNVLCMKKYRMEVFFFGTSVIMISS